MFDWNKSFHPHCFFYKDLRRVTLDKCPECTHSQLSNLLAFCKIGIMIYLLIPTHFQWDTPFQGLAEHDFRVLEFQTPRGAAFPGQRRLIAEANVFPLTWENCARTLQNGSIDSFSLHSVLPIEPIALSLSFRSRILFARFRNNRSCRSFNTIHPHPPIHPSGTLRHAPGGAMSPCSPNL